MFVIIERCKGRSDRHNKTKDQKNPPKPLKNIKKLQKPANSKTRHRHNNPR